MDLGFHSGSERAISCQEDGEERGGQLRYRITGYGEGSCHKVSTRTLVSLYQGC